MAATRDRRQPPCRMFRSAMLAGFLVAASLCPLGSDALADPVSILPEGPGRELIEHKCTQCHSLEPVTRSRRTRRQWEAQLDTMIARGARMSDEDFERIADYLANQFGLMAKD